MQARSDISGIGRIIKHLKSLSDIEIRPLAEEMGRIMVEENRRRLLAGLDSDEKPMPPTKRELGIGSSQRRGSGPPLVPRRTASRAIALFRVIRYERSGKGEMRIVCGWDSFDTRKGQSIPDLHARPGPGARYPRRDIKRVGPTAIKRCREAAVVFYVRKVHYGG